jgi:hypothetical protein
MKGCNEFYDTGPFDRIYSTLFSPLLTNGLNKLKRYIALGWKGLQTLANGSILKLQRKLSVVNMTPEPYCSEK